MNRNLFFALVVAALMSGQKMLAQPEDSKTLPLSAECGCTKALDETIDKVTRVYAGFEDKVSDKTKPEYDRLVDLLRAKAVKARMQGECLLILQAYVSFFKDHHVIAFWQGKRKRAVLSSEVNQKRSDLVSFRQLNQDYIYLRLAAFDQREVDKLDSLLIANKALLAKTPYVIIDLRGNGGGNTSTSDEMIRLIYTNTLTYPSWEFRSSPEYIASLEKDLKSQKDTTDVFYIRNKQQLKALKENPGKLVSAGEDFTRSSDANPTANPQHVAFLIDKGCGSATEFFIFEGKQSKKVTLFGANSHGVMDYGNQQSFELCDGTFNLAVPWGRNGWVRDFRIDNVGFAPDVRIPENETDWIAFVQRYYAQKAAK
jgi:hypothetical protein